MAEKKSTKEAPKDTAAKRSREIKDAGQRVVFAGLRMDRRKIAEALAESMELPPLPGLPVPTKQDKVDEVNKMLELLRGGNEDGPITVWVRVGAPVEGSLSKGDAVQAAVDKPLSRKAPGRFRAPTRTHWRGEVRRTAPVAVPLDEVVVD